MKQLFNISNAFLGFRIEESECSLEFPLSLAFTCKQPLLIPISLLDVLMSQHFEHVMNRTDRSLILFLGILTDDVEHASQNIGLEELRVITVKELEENLLVSNELPKAVDSIDAFGRDRCFFALVNHLQEGDFEMVLENGCDFGSGNRAGDHLLPSSHNHCQGGVEMLGMGSCLKLHGHCLDDTQQLVKGKAVLPLGKL